MKVACLWFHHEVNMLEVAEHCLRLSPQICFRKEQALFIEFGKCRRLYSENSFLARTQVILNRLSITASIGIAGTIPEALLQAKYQKPFEELPLIALLELADPFDRDELMQKYILQMIHSFQDLGIRLLEQFRKVPQNELTNRFGAIGILCSQRTRGEIHLAWPFWKPLEIIRERSEFPYFEFYGELEPILFALKKQFDSIFQRLFARGQRAQKMQIKIFCEVNSQQLEKFRLFEFDFMLSQSTTKGTLAIVQERLTREFQKKPIITPIEALESIVTETVPGQTGQKNLLNNHEEVQEQLHSLVNRLGEVHGKKNIFQVQLTEDRRPERSWQKVVDATQAGIYVDTSRLPLRPTYLVRPERIQLNGELIYIREKKYKILHCSEYVERMTGAWHEIYQEPRDEDGPPLEIKSSYQRDYYHLELDSGITISVFKTAEAEFYLHGYFG